MVKNFKNLRNQEADDLETWYPASGNQVLPMFSYDQDQDSLLVKRRNDNHSPGPVIRELVPSSHQRVNLATQSSASSADEIRESGRAFQSLIV